MLLNGLLKSGRARAAKYVLLLAALAGLLAHLSTSARGAELEVLIQPAEPGAKQEGDLILASQGDIISSLQVDLRYNPEKIQIEVEASPALAEQEKTLRSFNPEPGVLRLLVFGWNANPLLDASIARLHVTGAENSTEEERTITLEKLTASSPEGQRILLRPKGSPAEERNTEALVSLWDDSAVPEIISDTDTNGLEVGLKFQSDVAGEVVGVRFYKGASSTDEHIGNLWSASGELLASVAFTNETESGWQQAFFTAPIPIEPNKTYLISYYAPKGGYSVTSGYFAWQGAAKPPLRALQSGGADGNNGVYHYGDTSAFPDESYHDSNYWVDVIFRPASTV